MIKPHRQRNRHRQGAIKAQVRIGARGVEPTQLQQRRRQLAAHQRLPTADRLLQSV